MFYEYCEGPVLMDPPATLPMEFAMKIKGGKPFHIGRGTSLLGEGAKWFYTQ
jgi:hypothetical protein